MSALSDEHGEMFHQGISQIEKSAVEMDFKYVG
jgi:hypothetical protein